MRRTAIKPKHIHASARHYLRSRPKHAPSPLGGRPREYDDAVILTIACLQTLHQFSLREALEFSEDYFAEVPTLSTYHCRLERIPPDIAQGFIIYLGERIRSQKNARNVRFFIMDGTGFSYDDCYPMQFYLGTDIRKLQAHVKAVVIAGVCGKRRFVVSAATGPPYASETKLVQPLPENLTASGAYVLGDKGFNSRLILATICAKKCRPVIAVKTNKRYRNIDPLRIRSKQNADNPKLYKNGPSLRVFLVTLSKNSLPISAYISSISLSCLPCFALPSSISLSLSPS
jgi:hypothetical protein